MFEYKEKVLQELADVIKNIKQIEKCDNMINLIESLEEKYQNLPYLEIYNSLKKTIFSWIRKITSQIKYEIAILGRLLQHAALGKTSSKFIIFKNFYLQKQSKYTLQKKRNTLKT